MTEVPEWNLKIVEGQYPVWIITAIEDVGDDLAIFCGVVCAQDKKEALRLIPDKERYDGVFVIKLSSLLSQTNMFHEIDKLLDK